MLPPEVTDRLHKEGDIVALKMRRGSDIVLAYLQINTVERPNDLLDYSLGAASALATAGTGWNEILDSSSYKHLEPEFEEILYQAFYGITPSFARVYRQFPSGRDLGSLRGTRVVGTDPIGFVDGLISPYKHPSPVTEFYNIKGTYPAFFGYHPYAEPSSITVRMNFFISTYGITSIGDTITEEEKKKAKIVTMGGRTLLQVPQWLR